MKWFTSQRQQLDKLRAKVVGSSLLVRYTFAHGGKYVYGRVYPEHHLSFGEVAGDIRAYILGDDWTALDFVNCHPNIMYQALVMSGRASEFTNLGEYCSNRDRLLKEVMATYGVDRDAAYPPDRGKSPGNVRSAVCWGRCGGPMRSAVCWCGR